MKITDKTRIKVYSTICTALGFHKWDRWSTKDKLKEEYNLVYTSRRWNIFYFKANDESKLALFMLKYGEYLK